MAWRSGLASPPSQLLGMIGPRVAEYLRARHHALLELLWKRGQRTLICTQRPQTVPGKRHRHPSVVLFDRSAGLLDRMHRLKDGGQPGPPGGSVPKRQKFVSPGDRRRTGQENVLDVVQLEHVISS